MYFTNRDPTNLGSHPSRSKLHPTSCTNHMVQIMLLSCSDLRLRPIEAGARRPTATRDARGTPCASSSAIGYSTVATVYSAQSQWILALPTCYSKSEYSRARMRIAIHMNVHMPTHAPCTCNTLLYPHAGACHQCQSNVPVQSCSLYVAPEGWLSLPPATLLLLPPSPPQ